MKDVSVAVILLVVAGLIQACFTRVMKFIRKWPRENTWLVFTVAALWILPVVATLLTVPDADLTYGQVGKRVLATAVAFGVGWGISSIFLTLAVDTLGIAVAVSVVVGLSAAVGSVGPLFLLLPAKVSSPAGMSLIHGAALVVVGAVTCAIAGWLRQRGAGEEDRETSAGIGIIFAILSGLGAGLLNFALLYGGPLLFAAELNGAERMWAPNAIWLPLMIGASGPNVVYCGFRLWKYGTMSNFVEAGSGSQWALTLLMAVLWFGSIQLYGIHMQKLGEWGVLLGWPIFMAGVAIAGSLLDLITGEWKGRVKWPLLVQAAGVAVLVAAVAVLASGSQRG